MSTGSSLAHSKTESLSTRSGTGGEGGGAVEAGGKPSGARAAQPVSTATEQASIRATNHAGVDGTGLIIEKNTTVCNFLFCGDVVQYRTHHKVVFFLCQSIGEKAMLTAVLHKIFSSKNDRELKKLRPLVEEINRLEPEFAGLSPEALQAKTAEFKSRIQTTTHDLRTRLADLQARVLSEETQEGEPDEGREALKEEADKLEKELLQAEAEVLDALLPQAFAAVREASRRTTGMRHFDSQLLGGIVLHQGKIAEMKTGEGKTLVATLPLYLNALLGR